MYSRNSKEAPPTTLYNEKRYKGVCHSKNRRSLTRMDLSANPIQNDPDYYPNPEVFDTDRFSPESKLSRDS